MFHVKHCRRSSHNQPADKQWRAISNWKLLLESCGKIVWRIASRETFSIENRKSLALFLQLGREVF